MRSLKSEWNYSFSPRYYYIKAPTREWIMELKQYLDHQVLGITYNISNNYAWPIFRILQWRSWDLCSFGMWPCISGRLVPSVLRQFVGLVFKSQTFPPWPLNTSGTHPSRSDVVPHSGKMETLELRININDWLTQWCYSPFCIYNVYIDQ